MKLLWVENHSPEQNNQVNKIVFCKLKNKINIHVTVENKNKRIKQTKKQQEKTTTTNSEWKK